MHSGKCCCTAVYAQHKAITGFSDLGIVIHGLMHTGRWKAVMSLQPYSEDA